MLIAFAALLVDHVVIVNTLWYVHEMVNMIQSLYIGHIVSKPKNL